MNPMWKVFAGLAALLVPFTVVYWIWSNDPSGNALFPVSIVSLLFLAAYLWSQARGRTLPEDRGDATHVDAAGDVGTFPARSIWPLALGASATLLAFGLAFNGWIALPGGLGLLTSCVGMAFESSPAVGRDQLE